MKVKLENNIGECPVCGEYMTPNDTERSDGKYIDIYTCEDCEIGVTYISPDDGRGEYHLFNDGEIEIVFEKGA